MYNTILNYLKQKDFRSIHECYLTMNEADIGTIFQDFYEDEEIEKSELIKLFRLLPKDIAADVFSYMDSDTQEILLTAFTDEELEDVLDDLYVDDTVDLIEEMPAYIVARILKNSDEQTRKQINTLLRYPKDSAGALMTTEYIYLKQDYTVKEAVDRIRRIGMAKETIYTLYVTENRKLIGVVSVLELLVADEDARIGDIMETNVISVDTMEDKEIVAGMLSKYDFTVLPVVDKENRMVGIITFDDAMDVIQEENTEDMTKMAAVVPNDESYFKTSVFKHAKNRIVWLLILMLSATLTGSIISKYEAAFAAIPVLVSFIPMLTDTGGNCGSQTSTIVIRSMSLGEIEMKDFFKVMFKEFRIALLCSFVLAVVNSLRILIMYHSSPAVDGMRLAATVGIAIIATVILSKLIACMLPMVAKKLRLDPAIVASPLITTIVDACSTMLFFMTATAIFHI